MHILLQAFLRKALDFPHGLSSRGLMRYSKPSFILSLSLVALLACQREKPDARLHRLSCEPGKSIQQRFTSRKSILEKKEKARPTVYLEESTYTLHCIKVLESALEMELEYDRQRFEKETPEGRVLTMRTDFDSKFQNTGQAPPEALGSAILAGMRVRFEISPRAEIIKILNIEELQKDAARKLRRLGPVVSREILDRELTEDQFRATVSQAFIVLPEKKAGTKDTWQVQRKRVHPLPVEEVFTYTVESITGDSFQLSVTGSVASDPRAAVESQGMKLYYDVSGQATGEVLLDQGRPRSGKWKLVTAGPMRIEGESLPRGKMETGLEITTELTLETL